jgi:hypothetical protein
VTLDPLKKQLVLLLIKKGFVDLEEAKREFPQFFEEGDDE